PVSSLFTFNCITTIEIYTLSLHDALPIYSMMRNPRPTRAEVTDVANAIYDGTDAIMLSGETAIGKYPVEALKMMAHIAASSEKYATYEVCRNRNVLASERVISNALSLSTVSTAELLNAKAIIAPTMGGFTAMMLS